MQAYPNTWQKQEQACWIGKASLKSERYLRHYDMCQLPLGQYLHGDHGDQQPCLPSALHLCLYEISTSCLCFLMCTILHMRVMRGHLASGIAGVQFADVLFLIVISVNARKQHGWSTICCGAFAAPASTIYVKHLNIRIVAPK